MAAAAAAINGVIIISSEIMAKRKIINISSSGAHRQRAGHIINVLRRIAAMAAAACVTAT